MGLEGQVLGLVGLVPQWQQEARRLCTQQGPGAPTDD